MQTILSGQERSLMSNQFDLCLLIEAERQEFGRLLPLVSTAFMVEGQGEAAVRDLASRVRAAVPMADLPSDGSAPVHHPVPLRSTDAAVVSGLLKIHQIASHLAGESAVRNFWEGGMAIAYDLWKRIAFPPMGAGSAQVS